MPLNRSEGPRPQMPGPVPPRRSFSRMHLIGLYLAMGPLELYGRLTGVYRPRFEPPAHPVVNSPAGDAGPVVCFGDSLTEGYGAPPGASYPEELARMLAPAGIEVLNRGRSGDTAADGRARLETDVLSLSPRPRTVIVGFGGNDLIHRRPVEETFSDLEFIIRRLQAEGCLVVLLGLRGSWLYKVDYETPFHRLAERTGCGLVPLCLDGIWGCPWRMADAAHPNARGYRLLARRVAEVLQPHLRETAPQDRCTFLIGPHRDSPILSTERVRRKESP